MSPRAAWRLETIGFTRVYDYTAGKTDWSAAGLPLEGESTFKPKVGDHVRGNGVTCSLGESLRVVRERVTAAGVSVCIVTTGDNIVLGRIRGRALRGDPDTLAEAAMSPGPSTVRPDADLAEIADNLGGAGLKSMLVSDQDGKLVGTLYLEDARKVLAGD